MNDRSIEYDIERTLVQLRTVIREKGFTQLDVQKELGWGRSYISQLFGRQKAIRLEQILMILKVVNVEPLAFFTEVYRPGEGFSKLQVTRPEPAEQAAKLRGLELRLEALVSLLKKRRVISHAELAKTLKKARLMT